MTVEPLPRRCQRCRAEASPHPANGCPLGPSPVDPPPKEPTP